MREWRLFDFTCFYLSSGGSVDGLLERKMCSGMYE